MHYVVKNVDIDDHSTTPEELANSFYVDSNQNMYELKQIFPDGIKSWAFPSPVPTELLKKFSSLSEPSWYSRCTSTMARFRQELLDDKSERQRMWQSVEDWKQRLRFSFDTETFKTLAGLSILKNKHVQVCVLGQLLQADICGLCHPSDISSLKRICCLFGRFN